MMMDDVSMASPVPDNQYTFMHSILLKNHWMLYILQQFSFGSPLTQSYLLESFFDDFDWPAMFFFLLGAPMPPAGSTSGPDHV